MEDYTKIIIILIKKDMFFESCEILNSFYNFKEIDNDKLIINVQDENFLNQKRK